MSKKKYKGDAYIPSNRESRRRKRAEILRKLPRRYRKRWKQEAKLNGDGPFKKFYEEVQKELHNSEEEE